MGPFQGENTTNIPTIPEYFKGKSIFITGGSGFMGQALVEKLLYSCPELDRIYLLMREKKGVSPEDRLEKLYSSTCFDRLKQEKPFIFMEKVSIIPGDLLEMRLGLSTDDRALLINKIDTVFNVAASVRFDDPLPYAAKLNIRGTKEVIELAKQMSNIKSFVHVSTCYSNTNHDVIDEVLYPPLADWRDVLEVCEALDPMTIQVMTPKYLNGMPNTYVFTKQLSEHMVNEERGNLPIVIVRPSMVFPSIEEPAPGWTNNFNGPAALIIPCGLGIKHSAYCKGDTVFNIIPLDVCIRSFIVLAWATGTGGIKCADSLPIYNGCESSGDSIPIEDLSLIFYNCSKKYPFNFILWEIRPPILTNVLVFHYILTLVYSVFPALLFDLILRLLGKNFSLLKIQRKIYTADLILNYYVCRKWSMINNKFYKVRELIKPEDRNTFYYDVEGLYKSDYFEILICGAKKYLLNEDMKDLDKAKAFSFRVKTTVTILRILFYAYIFWWVSSKFL